MRTAASGGAVFLALVAVLVATRGAAQPQGGVWRTLACPPPRIHHTATLLADGRVLVAGGVGGTRSDTALADAHLFDPATDRWTAAPPMPEPRYHHTATRLPDGRVVIAGGQGASRTLDSVVAFDPARSSWTRLASLGSARRGHSASLALGTLYVAGGLAGDGVAGIRDVERFDAARGAFVAAPPLRQPRYLHSTAELPDGRLVLADSTGVEVYPAGPASPSTRGWHPLAAAVALHSATLLADGRVLVAFGHSGTCARFQPR